VTLTFALKPGEAPASLHLRVGKHRATVHLRPPPP
jgi:hypothetical protein